MFGFSGDLYRSSPVGTALLRDCSHLWLGELLPTMKEDEIRKKNIYIHTLICVYTWQLIHFDFTLNV